MILKFLLASCLARDAIAGFGSPDKNACPSGDVATSCKGRYPMSEGFWLQCVVQNAICKCVRMCVCVDRMRAKQTRAHFCVRERDSMIDEYVICVQNMCGRD